MYPMRPRGHRPGHYWDYDYYYDCYDRRYCCYPYYWSYYDYPYYR